jgi:PAS domain S-box-containing protein
MKNARNHNEKANQQPRLWPYGTGEMAKRIRNFAWDNTPLGAIDSWQPHLRTHVDLMLASPFPVCIYWGRDGIMIYNDSYAEFAGNRHPEILGHPLIDAWPEIADFSEAMLEIGIKGETLMLEDQPLTLERSGKTEQLWFDLTHMPILDNTGNTHGLYALVVDVTTRKQMQILLEGQKRAFELATSNAPLPFILETIAKTAEAQSVTKLACSVLLVEDNKLHHGGAPSLPKEYNDYVDGLPIGPKAGSCGTAAWRQEEVVVTDIATDPLWEEYREGTLALGLKACWSTPIISTQGKTIGTFAIYYPETRGPTHHDREVARLLSHTASIIIERQHDLTTRKAAEKKLRASEQRFRMLSELDEATNDLENPSDVMHIIARIVGEKFEADRCAYADVEDDENRFTIQYDYCVEGQASTVGEYDLNLFGTRATKKMRNGKILVIRDVDSELKSEDGGATFSAIGIKAIITCPLIKDDKLTAMIALHSATPRNWTEEEIQLFGTVAERSWAYIERARLDRELRDSEENFRQLANATPQVVWAARPDGQLDYINDRCFQYSGETLVRNGIIDWTAIVHPDDTAQTTAAWLKSVQSGEPYNVEQRIYHKETDSYRWNLTLALPARNSAGQIVRWFGTNTDIDDQKRINEVLKASEERFRILADSMAQMIWVTRADGFHEYYNKQWYDFTGVPEGSTDGDEWNGMFHPDDQERARERWRHSLDTGEPYEIEYRLRRHDGVYCWVLGRALPDYDDHGNIVKWYGTCTNIEEHKRAESLLFEAREAAEAASVAKSEFLANMSHEIRTPMNAVIGMSHILARTEPMTPKQRDCVKTLQMSAAALLDLINDLLDIAKIESHNIELEKTHFNLAQILNDVVSMMSVKAREKGLTFTADTDSIKDHGFVGDPARLRQVLLNLCSNAVKFTEKGGVHVSGDCRKGTEPGMMDITIKVRDTGIGIASDKLDTIFQKFMQADSSINRKYGGTGLGLAITKTLIEIMDGTVAVTSTVDAGSTFILNLTLPASDEILPEAETSASVAEPHHNNADNNDKQRVLLVEDYAPNVLVTSTFLEEFGYEYDVASDGYEALAKIASTQYMAVLMDVQMHGMNGLEATQAIRKLEAAGNKRRLPIIGMTAHALTGDRERCIAAGMDDYLSKPFNPDTLEKTLKEFSRAV